MPGPTYLLPYSMAMTVDTEVRDLVLPDQATMQALTEEAVEQREKRPNLEAELFVPAIHLAQQVTSQLDAYNLLQDEDEEVEVRDPGAKRISRYERDKLGQGWADHAEGCRRYKIMTLAWHVGPWWRRGGWRRARVLVCKCPQHGAWQWTPLWNPQAPDALWDLERPPKTNFIHDRNYVRLPTASVLSQWSKDAQEFMTSVCNGERQRTEHIQDGVEQSEIALQCLAV